MGHTAVGIKCGELILDGVVTMPPETSVPVPGVVVCHPHPVFGGNMDNAVVIYICELLSQAGFASIRFNFRSVGKGSAAVTDAMEEQEDVEAALNMLKNWHGVKRDRMGLVGYSFGASVILKGLKRYKAAKALVFISPPSSAVQSEVLGREKRPRLIIVGERDKLVNADVLRGKVEAIESPPEIQVVPDADHGWRGKEMEVAQRVVDFCTRNLY
jgi:alpha/beta superfamily hydrolase